jgi:hypothetical protein
VIGLRGSVFGTLEELEFVEVGSHSCEKGRMKKDRNKSLKI